MDYQNIKSLEDFNQITEIQDAVLLYFSHEQCNVCKVLKPKIAELVNNEFSNIGLYYSDTVLQPEIAGQNSIFTVPTLVVYFMGKESIRKSRNIGLDELRQALQRPYDMIFG